MSKEELADREAERESEPAEAAPGAQDDGAEEEVLTVQIGEDGPDDDPIDKVVAEGPEWLRDMRKRDRESAKKIRDLEAKLAGPKAELGEKPTLAGCDYDNDDYEAKLAAWFESKREHDAAEESAAQARERQDARWQQKLTAYSEGKAKLGAKDYDEAEDMVRELLAPGFNGMGPVEDLRLNIIKQGARDPNLVIYALGKNTKRLKELAEIDDPVEFAMAVGRLEGELKVTRKAGTQPERAGIAGAGTGAGSVDNTLERLRAEAEKSGDYSKVTAYKRKLRETA